MRKRKTLEADILLGLSSLVCVYFLCAYVRALAIGGSNSIPGLFIAMFAGLAVAVYHIVSAVRCSRAGLTAAP
jgi:hypothetical protein